MARGSLAQGLGGSCGGASGLESDPFLWTLTYLLVPSAGQSVTMNLSSRTGIRTLPRIPS